MMYAEKLAAAIKVNGKVLREFKDQVYVPYSSEYSILIKNLNTRRAIVTVYIDGENQTPGGLVIDAGRECNLERSIKNNNLNEGNRFKFIERTNNIEKHRGVGIEDGIVRIEFEFEREPLQWYSNSSTRWDINDNTPHYGITCNNTYQGPLRGRGMSGSVANASLNNVSIGAQGAPIVDVTNAVAQNVSYNDAGITVAGSRSNQKFNTVSGVYGDGIKHNIVLKLLGETLDNKPVLKEVTVKSKPRCPTCNRQNKAHARFCTECGTSLKIFA